jgi:hypothetical protein
MAATRSSKEPERNGILEVDSPEIVKADDSIEPVRTTKSVQRHATFSAVSLILYLLELTFLR